MVNQILLHISNTPLELVEYCQKKGIAVEVYSPIAARFYTSRRLPLWLKNTEYLFHSFASVIHCSSVRFHFLKTGNPEHMKTNADVDFEISAEDMEVLKNFKHIESYGESSGFPVYGGKL